MITTVSMRVDPPSRPHAIPTRRQTWGMAHAVVLFVAVVAGAAFVGAVLVWHKPARARTPVVMAPVSVAVGAIDHSSLNNPALLPEPNAALLHSSPNDYVPLASGSASDAAAVVRAIPKFPDPYPVAAGVGP